MKRRDFLNLTPDQRRQFFAREIVGKKLYRQLPTIKRENINEEDRTIDLSIATDAPYDRWYYTEILSHEKGAVRLGRLNDGGAFCSDHDTRRQIGAFVPGTVRIEDHKTRGLVKFSERKAADDEWKDVLAGIRTKTSVGYIIHKYEYDEKTDTLTAIDWEPLEGSLVAVPADTDTGTDRELDLAGGRADEACSVCGDPDCADPDECDEAGSKSKAQSPKPQPQKNQIHPTHTTRRLRRARKGATTQRTTTMARPNTKRALRTQPQTACTPDSDPCNNERCDVHYEDASEERAAAVSPAPTNYAERFRSIAEAAALGAEEKKRFLAIASTRALESDEPDESELRKELLADRKKTFKATSPDPEHPETVASRIGGDVQLARIRSRVHLKYLKTHEEAFVLGRFLGGVMGLEESKSWCKENGISLRRVRAQSEGDNESGGVWVPTEWSDSMVVLREKNSIVRQFADIETMTSRTKNVRRQRQGLTAYPAGIKGTSRKVAQSEIEWDFFELIARKWKVTTKFEDEVTDDAMISFADKFAGESAYAFGRAEARSFFLGDGTSTYHGIVGLSAALLAVDATIGNIKGLTVASGNLFSEFVMGDFTKLVASLPEYADTENCAWYMSRYFFWNVVVPLMLAAGGTTVQEIENAPIKKFLSYPVRICQELPRANANSQVATYLGDLTLSSTFGDRLGQQVRQTDTNDDDWDNDLISMKCIERFDINHHDVGDTTDPGPVVGLISAAA